MMRKKRNILAASLLTGVLAIAAASPAAAQANSPTQGTVPKVGDLAPDFMLNYFDGNDLKEVSLSQYRGKKNVVVAFFIFAFTGG
jgi:AhpC/TSA family